MIDLERNLEVYFFVDIAGLIFSVILVLYMTGTLLVSAALVFALCVGGEIAAQICAIAKGAALSVIYIFGNVS